MDDDKYTVTVTTSQARDVFDGCSDVNGDGENLTFTDKNGKTHEFHGASYHIAQE
jgi:hypothetical protein